MRTLFMISIIGLAWSGYWYFIGGTPEGRKAVALEAYQEYRRFAEPALEAMQNQVEHDAEDMEWHRCWTVLANHCAFGVATQSMVPGETGDCSSYPSYKALEKAHSVLYACQVGKRGFGQTEQSEVNHLLEKARKTIGSPAEMAVVTACYSKKQ